MPPKHEDVLAECQVARAKMLERLNQGDEKFDQILRKLDKIDANVESMRNDHEIRLVKLEEAKKSQTWVLRTVAAAIIALGCESLWHFFKK